MSKNEAQFLATNNEYGYLSVPSHEGLLGLYFRFFTLTAIFGTNSFHVKCHVLFHFNNAF